MVSQTKGSALDSLLFDGETENRGPNEEPVSATTDDWKILVVDDDEMMHHLTDAVLEDFTFRDRKLNIIHGYSGEEACRLMTEHPDIAVVLLDVVMETVNAGFEVVRYIRDTLRNRHVRIILRTGQPGTASETDIISKYEINDYREKSDLTSAKLHSSLIVSLRAYQDMKIIQAMAKSGVVVDSMLQQANSRLLGDKESIRSDFGRLFVDGKMKEDEKNHLLSIINGSASIVYIKDLAASYLLVNNTFEKFFHVSLNEIVGKRDDDFLPKPLAEQIMKSDLRVLSGSVSAQQEESMEYDDVRHMFYALKFPLFDSSGKFSAICGIITEIVD